MPEKNTNIKIYLQFYESRNSPKNRTITKKKENKKKGGKTKN